MNEHLVHAALEQDHTSLEQVAEGVWVNKEAPNDTLLTFSRMHNEHIRAKHVDLIMEYHRRREASGKPVYVVARDPATNELLVDERGRFVRIPEPYVAPTREAVEREYDEKLKAAEFVTYLTHEGKEPSPGSVDLTWRIPGTDTQPTTKQYAIIEAHEKGHVVRSYPVDGGIDPIGERIAQGFDWRAVEYTNEMYTREHADHDQDEPYEKARSRFYAYMADTDELVERMAQLKNYFGMQGDEEFTRAHLDYARAHYIEDVGFDNRMTPFFDAITPEREEAFLGLMNTIGV